MPLTMLGARLNSRPTKSTPRGFRTPAALRQTPRCQERHCHFESERTGSHAACSPPRWFAF
eukprot:6209091-Pleurochrysis_carterae.AAC.4